MQYDVFISYSRKDYVDDKKNIIPDNVVSRIKESLSDAGITYWFDEEGINYGNNFVDKIVSNIEKSHIFLFLATENSNNSRWTCKEIASADELGKYIIPVRVDNTPYNKQVLFRIADISYIDYFNNPERGIRELLDAIKKYLTLFQEEKKQKAEAEIRKLEQKKREEDECKKRQEQLINYIQLSCYTLNNQEEKLEIDRKNLLLKIEEIIDKEQRILLKQQIEEGGCIYKLYKNKLEEIITNHKIDIAKHQQIIDRQDKAICDLNQELEKLLKSTNYSDDEGGAKIKIGYFSRKFTITAIIISCIFFVMGLLLTKLVIVRFLNTNEPTTIEPSSEEVIVITAEPLSPKKIEPQTFIANGVAFTMVGVTGGMFHMGVAVDQDTDAFPDEGPMHEVIVEDYYIGETEVTQELWQAVMGENPSDFKDLQKPVECVSWNDCQEFIEQLSLLTGKAFRLPTEAEWEYAARGGNNDDKYKYSGSDSIENVAVFYSNSNGCTNVVKGKQPNSLGLYDMSGNVSEWCLDLYKSYDNKDSFIYLSRVYRGGSWRNDARRCRVSNRRCWDPQHHSYGIGLRIALSYN